MSVGYSTREVARLLKLPEHRIRAYVRAGLVGHRDTHDGTAEARPGAPLRFDFRDLLVLKMARKLLAQGLSPGRVQRMLVSLKRQMAAEQPLSGTQLFTHGSHVLASDGDITWEPESGQCLLRFDSEAAVAASPVLLEPVPEHAAGGVGGAATALDPAQLGSPESGPDSADYWFDMALDLEDTQPQQAYDAYLRALACNPEHVEATINIGRLCSQNGDARRAAAYFRQAVRIDPQHPVAHFNLAVTLHDLGDIPGALAAYRAALEQDPDFADAHYNLATLLEQQGHREEALRHMQAYRRVRHEYDG